MASLGVLPGEGQRSLLVQRERGVAPLVDISTNIIDVLVDFSYGASATAPHVLLLSLVVLIEISSIFLGMCNYFIQATGPSSEGGGF